MTRTFVPGVVRRRIVNTALLHTKKQRLMSIVTERFYQKEKNNELLVAILSHAVECRGAEDGAHMTHVGLATGLLLQRMMEKTDRYHLEQADIEAIRMASELHDIGKLQIPAEILTKPGALRPRNVRSSSGTRCWARRPSQSYPSARTSGSSSIPLRYATDTMSAGTATVTPTGSRSTLSRTST